MYMEKGVMVASEVDFLNWSQMTVPALFSRLDAGHLFLKGMADAALAFNISHQCVCWAVFCWCGAGGGGGGGGRRRSSCPR